MKNIQLPTPYEPSPSEHWLKRFILFRSAFKPAIDFIYYPGCHNDISPSKAFPESSVLYADMDLNAVAGLNHAGFDACLFNANAFTLVQPTDLVIILNAGIEPAVATSSLRVNGYLLCNNYYHSANEAKEVKHLSHVGSIEIDDDRPLVDTQELDAYWQEVSSDEELIARDFSGVYTERVRRHAGKTENILAEYKKLMHEARGKSAAHERSMMIDIEEFPPVDEASYTGPLFVDPADHRTLLPYLPKKRGHTDTLFVFQRTS